MTTDGPTCDLLPMARTRGGVTPASAASPPGVCSAFLLGASGVWGGDDAYVTDSGEFWLRRLKIESEPPRMREWRYRLALSSAAPSELTQLVSRHREVHLKDTKLGPPDTPRVLLGITVCGKELVSIERSPHDRDPRFGEVHRWFLWQSAAAQETSPTHDGAPDPRWRPEGFPEVSNWHW